MIMNVMAVNLLRCQMENGAQFQFVLPLEPGAKAAVSADA
jgi:hypothetical protein